MSDITTAEVSVAVAIAFVFFLLGFTSHFFLTKKEVTLEKQVALLILVSWLSFAMISYLQARDLSLFFNAAGMGAVGNLLGIKTSELLGSLIKRK
jgi:hypothetical protein